jgi:TolB protein
MMRKSLFVIAANLFLSTSVGYSQTSYIPVGSAKTKKTILAFPKIKFRAGGTAAQAEKIHETVTSDLVFMDLFKFLDADAFTEEASAGIRASQFRMADWAGTGTEFLIKAELSMEPGAVVLESYLYDVNGAKQVLGKRYVATPNEIKILAHTLANDIVNSLTGLPGIFLTKLAFSCDRTGKKELYISDFDGTDVKQITHHRSIAFAPAWSPDGTRLAYSLFTKRKNNVKNIDLYEFDFRKNTIRMLSNRKGINSGANYNPDGRRLALTMSFLGNPEIFVFDPVADTVTRVTKSFGVDVDPAWSPDGKKMAFVSSRSGMPMVYSMNADGTNVTRLTYAGRYNATPTWSPMNGKIGFAGWIDGIFDIFIMNPDGTNIERLTKSQGNNEDPHFSPDGNFLVFSSNRTGQKNIYVMNVDGTFVKRLTFGLGNCVSPKWSNPPAPAKSTPAAG